MATARHRHNDILKVSEEDLMKSIHTSGDEFAQLFELT